MSEASDLQMRGTGKWYSLPVGVGDELRPILLHLPLSVATLRWPVRSEFLATDATPSRLPPHIKGAQLAHMRRTSTLGRKA